MMVYGTNRKRTKKGGFTLLEVLVAFAIVGVALTVILQLFAGNSRGIADSEAQVAASVKAESVMRRILDDDGLSVASWEEETDDGYRVQVVITDTEEERTENIPVRLLQISLTLSWLRDGTERSLKFGTLKMVRKGV